MASEPMHLRYVCCDFLTAQGVKKARGLTNIEVARLLKPHWPEDSAYPFEDGRKLTKHEAKTVISKFVAAMKRGVVPTAYCYIVGAEHAKYVKIGFTTDPWSRFDDLQVGHPEPLFLYALLKNQDQNTEKRLHKHFEKQHYRGEWFRVEGELKEYLARFTPRRYEAVCGELDRVRPRTP